MTINRKVSARELRRQLAAEAELTHARIVPAVNHLLVAVERLEGRVDLSGLSWWRRVWWLLTGRV